MTATLDPVLLGPIMITIVVLWFLGMPLLFKEPRPVRAQAASDAVRTLPRRDAETTTRTTDAEGRSLAA